MVSCKILIVNSMSEELESGEKEMLIEINILNKVKSFVSKTWSKVTNLEKDQGDNSHLFLVQLQTNCDIFKK